MVNLPRTMITVHFLIPAYFILNSVGGITSDAEKKGLQKSDKIAKRVSHGCQQRYQSLTKEQYSRCTYLQK